MPNGPPVFNLDHTVMDQILYRAHNGYIIQRFKGWFG